MPLKFASTSGYEEFIRSNTVKRGEIDEVISFLKYGQTTLDIGKYEIYFQITEGLLMVHVT